MPSLQLPYGNPFEIDRAILRDNPSVNSFSFSDTTARSLNESLRSGEVSPETMLQLAEVGGRAYAFLTVELLMFDVAQYQGEVISWIATFCPVCNSGAVFSATLNKRTMTFSAGGLYNAMALLRDHETGSFWDHIHGVCLHGPQRGSQLERLGLLRHISVSETLRAYPDARLARATLTDVQRSEALDDDRWRVAAQPDWSERMKATLAREDTRLPRLDMGLGVWNGTISRYYPFTTLNIVDNLLIDRFGDSNLVVYVDPETSIPDAFYTSARRGVWQNDTIVLNTGDAIQNGLRIRPTGLPSKLDRPLQLFMRWYGFSAMFPRCDIYYKQD